MRHRPHTCARALLVAVRNRRALARGCARETRDRAHLSSSAEYRTAVSGSALHCWQDGWSGLVRSRASRFGLRPRRIRQTAPDYPTSASMGKISILVWCMIDRIMRCQIIYSFITDKRLGYFKHGLDLDQALCFWYFLLYFMTCARLWLYILRYHRLQSSDTSDVAVVMTHAMRVHAAFKLLYTIDCSTTGCFIVFQM